MLCISTVEYSVLFNGTVVGSVVPGRGLRQGCPFSPYLFIVCAEGLSAMIRDSEARGALHGCSVCRNAPSISHLFFAVDSYLFFKTEAEVVCDILLRFEQVFGQAVNYGKSEVMFSSNICTNKQNEIIGMLGVEVTDGNSYYLGLPLVLDCSKRVIFGFLKDRLRKRLSSWQSKLLSRVGKSILIKTVAQALPTYSMGVFLIPPLVLEELQKMLNSFWWGSRRERHRVIRWQRWERLRVRREEGRLGFRDLRMFNLVLLGKQGWNLLTKPHTLVARVFKEKYFPSGDYLTSNLGSNPSFV